MAYVKQVWQDRVTEYPFRRKLYPQGHDPEDGAEYADIVRAQGEVFAEGTPVTAERLNHMENGIFAKQDAINAQNKLPYAYIANVPTVLPNPHPLTFGQKSYDGTASLSLSPADIGLGTVFNLRGSKASASGLPSSGNTVGDVWYVISEHVGYVWLNDGTARWEQLGLPIDLSNYAEIGGTYPGMSVGHAAEADSSGSAGHAETADSAESAEYADVSEYAAYAEQLDSTVALTVSSQFVFRPAGGGADVEGYLGSKADIAAIYGNTLVWNQLCTGTRDEITQNFTYEKISDFKTRMTGTPTYATTFRLTNAGNIPIIGGNKYYVYTGVPAPENADFRFGESGANTTFTGSYGILTAKGSSNTYIGLHTTSDAVGIGIDITYSLIVADLTKMFGAGNEPTADEFHSMFPLPYYAYDAGRLLNFTGTGIKTVGFNALAPDGTARLLGGKAYEIVGTYTALSYSTGEEIVPVDGIFTPSADGVLTVTGADAETCVHLTWSGYRNNETALYHTETKVLPVSTYFPDGMKTAGNGRDELTKDKAIKRVEKAKISDLTWYRDTSSGTAPFFYASSGRAWNRNANIKCLDYEVFRAGIDGSGNMSFATFGNSAPDRNIGCGASNGRIYIRDDRYTTKEQLIREMGDTVIYYELAEPVETPMESPLDLTFNSSDYGTEMLLPENGSAPVTSPMCADIRYVQNLRDKLQRLPCSPESAGWYFVRYDGVRQSYERLPALPAESGSYVLKCTVGEQEHTFFWETEADTE